MFDHCEDPNERFVETSIATKARKERVQVYGLWLCIVSFFFFFFFANSVRLFIRLAAYYTWYAANEVFPL